MVYEILGAVFALFAAFLCGFAACHTLHLLRAEKRQHAPGNAEKPEEKRNSFDEQFMNLMHYTGEKQNEG